jgi:hypothetical protein
MSDRLDRIEAGLEETRKIVDSNSRAIEAWANESAQYRRDAEERDRQLAASIERLVHSIERLTSISEMLVSTNCQLTEVVTMLAARQQDQENRINRLEQ